MTHTSIHTKYTLCIPGIQYVLALHTIICIYVYPSQVTRKTQIQDIESSTYLSSYITPIFIDLRITVHTYIQRERESIYILHTYIHINLRIYVHYTQIYTYINVLRIQITHIYIHKNLRTYVHHTHIYIYVYISIYIYEVSYLCVYYITHYDTYWSIYFRRYIGALSLLFD